MAQLALLLASLWSGYRYRRVPSPRNSNIAKSSKRRLIRNCHDFINTAAPSHRSGDDQMFQCLQATKSSPNFMQAVRNERLSISRGLRKTCNQKLTLCGGGCKRRSQKPKKLSMILSAALDKVVMLRDEGSVRDDSMVISSLMSRYMQSALR